MDLPELVTFAPAWRLQDMPRYRFLAIPGYCIGVFLIAVPLLDTLLSAWPLKPGIVGWRFGVLGLFANAFMTPLVGLFLVMALAATLEHGKVIRIVSVLSGIAAVCLFGALGLFLLDSLQMRSQVRPEAKTAFDKATVVAIAKYFYTGVILAVFSVKAWKGSPRQPRVSQTVDSLPLVVSSPKVSGDGK